MPEKIEIPECHRLYPESITDDLDRGEQSYLLREIVDLPEIPRRAGKKLNNRVPIRWATYGVRGVRLETLSTPSGRITTRPAIRRFFSALSGDAPAVGTRTPTRRRREHMAAERSLAAAGFKF